MRGISDDHGGSSGGGSSGARAGAPWGAHVLGRQRRRRAGRGAAGKGGCAVNSEAEWGCLPPPCPFSAVWGRRSSGRFPGLLLGAGVSRTTYPAIALRRVEAGGGAALVRGRQSAGLGRGQARPARPGPQRGQVAAERQAGTYPRQFTSPGRCGPGARVSFQAASPVHVASVATVLPIADTPLRRGVKLQPA